LKESGDSEINFPNCNVYKIDPLCSSETLIRIDKSATSEFILLIISESEIELGQFEYERISGLSQTLNAGIIYSDYFDYENDFLTPHQLIEYQTGSVRDNFNFGHILFFRKNIFAEAVNGLNANYKYAGLYGLRLNVSIKYPIIRIPEYLYSTRGKKIDENQFDYVDSKNKEVQTEMEEAFTEYLKRISALLSPHTDDLDLYGLDFKYEVSVIIPVKNRVRTIIEAVNSALGQKCNFPFNIIVVDNHSDDGTTEALSLLAKERNNLIHLIPLRLDLGIGGCWNEGISHPDCGRFVIQLDSDDIYSDDNTLQKVVNKFREEKCAMVIGSYKLTDFQYNLIPPGIIDHREWTEKNGLNNALRINGLGAPRAFFTPIIRTIKFPNVSYGEDYAAVLAIIRSYKIGRIYEPIYICRRWEGNSDSLLSIEKENSYNFYKDKIRTIEILIRQKLNSKIHD
jgi:glycosyltransferase involved in cell wall biosynthesis